VLAEVGEVVERVESEHGPPLCALDGEETSSGWGCALKGNEPLDDRQHTPYPPERSRVADDAGQFGKPGGKGAGGLIA